MAKQKLSLQQVAIKLEKISLDFQKVRSDFEGKVEELSESIDEDLLLDDLRKLRVSYWEFRNSTPVLIRGKCIEKTVFVLPQYPITAEHILSFRIDLWPKTKNGILTAKLNVTKNVTNITSPSPHIDSTLYGRKVTDLYTSLERRARRREKNYC